MIIIHYILFKNFSYFLIILSFSIFIFCSYFLLESLSWIVLHLSQINYRLFVFVVLWNWFNFFISSRYWKSISWIYREIVWSWQRQNNTVHERNIKVLTSKWNRWNRYFKTGILIDFFFEQHSFSMIIYAKIFCKHLTDWC